ncbi:MAG: HugZ family protein, partial [Mesorhizobium sp.]
LGDDVCRVFFPEPLRTARELRHVLVDMAKTGRVADETQSDS